MTVFIIERVGLWLVTWLSTLIRIMTLSVIDNGQMKRQGLDKLLILSGLNAFFIILAVAIDKENGWLYLIGRGMSLILLWYMIKNYIGRQTLKYYLMQYTLILMYVPLLLLISLITKGNTVIYQIIHTSCEILPMLFLIYLLKRHKTSSISNGFLFILNKSYILIGSLYLLSEAIFSMSLISKFVNLVDDSWLTSIVLGSFTLVMFIVLVVLFLKERRQSIEIQHQAELLNAYTGTIEGLYDDVRSYKHDINNVLLTLRHFIDTSDWVSLEKFFREEIDGTGGFDLDIYKVLTQMNNIKIDVLKGLILSKYQKATIQGVWMNLGVEGQILDDATDAVDLCRLMGIFLDNAIEAAEESQKRQVYLYMTQEAEGIVIKISNDYNTSQPPIIVPKRNLTTKGSNRGMGLYSAQRIIKRNKRFTLETKLEGTLYTQLLSISK